MLDAAVMYDSPFIDLALQGPDALFTPRQVQDLVGVLLGVRATAIAE